MKTINILGNSQREQWHSVVNMLRQLGGDMTREGRSALCDEIDRYIDFAEDIFDEERAKDKESEDKEDTFPDAPPYSVVLVSDGGTRNHWGSFMTKEEAIAEAERYNWEYLDENEFLWRMEIEENW